MRRKIKKVLGYGSLTFMLLLNLLVISPVWAGGMSGLEARMWDPSGNLMNATDTTIDSISVYFTPAGEINTNNGVKINFQADFDISAIVGHEDAVVLSQTNSGTNITQGSVTISGQDLLIIADTQSDTPSGSAVVNVVGNHIYTPTVPGTYKISVSTWDLGADNDWGGVAVNADVLKDTGAIAVVIGLNLVNITAAVDPTLTLILSGNTCSLGTFSPNSIKTCNYSATVNTNASSGYAAYIKSDGFLRNPTNHISDVTGGTIADGTEAYGLATSKSGQTITRINDANTDSNYNATDCTIMNGGTIHANASALTESDQAFASSSVSVSNDVTSVCHAVAISGTTPAGTYSQLATITVIGNF